MERRCQEVIDRCWALGADNPISFIHDVGAGGISNALPELVNDGGRGGKFNLRALPNDEPGMSPLEIWCNESQERYVLAVPEDRLATFKQLCARERCPFAVVGEATGERKLVVEDPHFANTPIDMPLDVLLGKPPRMHRKETSLARPQHPLDLRSVTILEAAKRVLSPPAVADKTFLIAIGDRTVGGLICRDQMVGPWQVPVADCAVTAASFDVYTGEAMAMGERTPVAVNNAAASARLAVGEAITNLAAAQIGDLGKVNLSANWMAAPAVPGDAADLYAAVHAVGMELCPALGIARFPSRQGLDEHVHVHRLARRPRGQTRHRAPGLAHRLGVRLRRGHPIHPHTAAAIRFPCHRGVAQRSPRSNNETVRPWIPLLPLLTSSVTSVCQWFGTYREIPSSC